MKALVIGGARSGSSVSRLLRLKGYEVILTDAKEIDEKQALEALGILVYEQGHPDFLKEMTYDVIVKNPGIPYHVPFVKHFVSQGYFIYNETEIAYRYAPNFSYASITGTNGKTTTTALLEHILRQENIKHSACGNIGLPLSEMVLEHQHETLKIAMEISAFQLLGVNTYHPCVSVCTNLAADHLDYFDSLEAYYQAKMLVYKQQSGDDWFIRNLDDDAIVSYAQDCPCRIIDFSMSKKADLYWYQDQAILFDQVLFTRQDLKLVGKHNVANAMMASAMAYKMGIDTTLILKGIQTFIGVEHRIEFVEEVNQVCFYNDSKATTVESTIVALEAFDKPVILLAGGYDKKTGFAKLAEHKASIKHLIAFGETKHQILELYPATILVDNMNEAFNQAVKLADKEDIILLSPMCASYDQFDNFEKRGQIFKEYVYQYKGDQGNGV